MNESSEPKNKENHRIKRIIGILAGLAIVIVFLLVAHFSPAPKSPLFNSLYSSYTFSEILSAFYSDIGVTGIIAIVSGYTALAAFIASIPVSGAFGYHNSRVAGFYFLQQLTFWITIFFFLAVVRYWLPSITFVILYIFLIVGLVSSSFSTRDWSFKEVNDLVRHPRPKPKNRREAFRNTLSKWLNPLSAGNPDFATLGTRGVLDGFLAPLLAISTPRFWGSSFLTAVVLLEPFYLLSHNSSMPLVAMILLLYTLFVSGLQLAYCTGYLFQISASTYVEIVPIIGDKFEAFIIGKGPNHFFVLRKGDDKGREDDEKGIVLQTTEVREIHILKLQ